MVTFSVAVVVLGTAAAVLVPTLADDRPDCRSAPPATVALADDPQAATRAPDPGEDLSRIGRVKDVLGLRGKELCAGKDGVEVAGRALVAATADGWRSRSLAMARVAHAAVLALGEEFDRRIPDGLEPYLARMLAAYIVDANRDLSSGRGSDAGGRPAMLTEEASYSDGGSWLAAYARP
ncbi:MULTISPECIES: hypothetical protein [Streptomyces]|uniref:hypothetical protein n=1 Tax=Streptomyces TaxID=1883 RepID=UPI001180F7C0|nr:MULTISPECIES: hypothetical protein [Streptomyces]